MAIEFTNKPIKWTNKGTAPSEDLKTNGFQAGYKPPASVFNYQWHVTGECISELQEKLSDVDTQVTSAESSVSTLNDKITDLPIKSLAGQSVATLHKLNNPTTIVTASEGATIIGDTRERIFSNTSGYYSGSYVPESGNVATGEYSLAMGRACTSTGSYSIAGGLQSLATNPGAIAIGIKAYASGHSGSTALGYNVEATGYNGAIAMGYLCKATNSTSIAIGSNSESNGSGSVALGNHNTASGDFSVALGLHNTALACQTKMGHYAKDGTAGASSGTTGDAFIIGNGTFETESNCFRVTYSGDVYGLSTFKATGADYAEYFEWKDGNPDNEDRRGRLVTLDGDKIRFATAEDAYILGVISAAPCVEGDVYSDDWQGKYLTDVFGQRLTQTVHIPAKYEDIERVDENGERIIEKVLIEDEYDAVQWIINPDYDPEKEYLSREDRKEWSAIGLMGKLVVIDDGTCEVNGYCKAGVNGIATKADDGYRVMARIDDTHIRVLVR